MVKIQITAAPIEERSGVAKLTQKPYHMRTQNAYLYTVSKEGVLCDFPEKFQISLDDGQVPYAPGAYTFSDASFFIDAQNFNRVSVRPRLVPFPAAK